MSVDLSNLTNKASLAGTEQIILNDGGTAKDVTVDVLVAHIGASAPVTAKAPLASPTFTGNPAAPTPVVGDNDTSLATAEFVQREKEYLLSVTAALHSGAVVKAFVYDTSKDSDGGAWRKRTAHTSWYNEALGFTGKWLGQKASTATAWATSGAAAGDGFQNTTDGKYYVLTGTSTASEIFRGNVRKFPALVAVVAETARVILYDLTQPTCPMWMVFKAGTFAYTTGNVILAPSSLSSVAVRDAKMVFGENNATDGRLCVVDFVSEVIQPRQSAPALCMPYLGNIAQRNSGMGYGGGQATAIVNKVVNGVAITVLDTAPTDAATGLPVPTIYAFTAGGVSRIAHDGTVSSTATSSAVNAGWVDGDYVRAIGQAGLVPASWPLASALPTGGASHLNGYWTSGVYSPATIPSITANTNGKGVRSALGANTALFLVKENPSTIANGMTNAITNTYNSGWMVGDIKLAALADTTAETISGSGELVTNGDFASDTVWTKEAGWTISGGVASQAGDASARGISEPITLVAGRAYAVTYTVTRTAGSVYPMFTGGSTVWGVTRSASGTYTDTIVASAGNATLRIEAAAGFIGSIDNISVKLAEPDRCVKNKGLIVNGSLTKTAVASAAALVAWSGFSASNYLSQPYNSDLDFGTGDFCVMGWIDAATTGTSQYIFGRGAASNPTIALYHSTGGVGLICSATAAPTPNLVAITAGIHFLAMVRESGVLKLYFDNALVYSAANTANITNTSAQLIFGAAYDVTTPYLGKLALWRIGATAPSADQIAHIYRTELPLFQANAQCTLAGSSAAVTTMAYDEDTTLLHVGTSWGRSSFKDLTRIDSEATSTGALTSLSASGGVIVTGGTSGKVYMPALLLRDELRRKAEARKALGRVPVFFDYTATASQTAFVAPKGYTIKALYKNGALMRETTTGVYWTRSNDGFQETATLSVGASASDWISLMCVRA